MVFSLLWVCESPKWGLELEYARLTELIPWLPALQSVPVRQSSSSALNTTNSPALRAKAGLGGYPPGIELGGSERVVRAAGPATQRNPAPPFFRRKDKGCLERAVLWGFRTRRGVQNQPEAKKSPRLFSEDGKKRRGGQIWYGFSCRQEELAHPQHLHLEVHPVFA